MGAPPPHQPFFIFRCVRKEMIVGMTSPNGSGNKFPFNPPRQPIISRFRLVFEYSALAAQPLVGSPNPPLRNLPPNSARRATSTGEQLQFRRKEIILGQIAQNPARPGPWRGTGPGLDRRGSGPRWLSQSLCRARARGSGTTIVTDSPCRPMTTWVRRPQRCQIPGCGGDPLRPGRPDLLSGSRQRPLGAATI